ncbi:hypothetical protein FRC06_006359 [Ceratobasidium sp. 370]|nr:hypothetical protein FRC06_006359 [Ceratobasidium sp. 370]
MTKDVFLTLFSKAYIQTFTTDTIKSAFSTTGIHPFNPNIIPAIAMAPSLPTSTRSSLPVKLPEAVAAIASLWDMDPEELAGDSESMTEGEDEGEDVGEGEGKEGEGDAEEGKDAKDDARVLNKLIGDQHQQ